MLKPLFIVICCTILLVPCGLRAQTDSSISAAPVIWNLRQCLDYAKKNNITINNMRLTAASQGQNVVQSKAAAYPNLSGNASENIGHYQPGMAAGSNYGVSSSMVLYQGGYLKNDIRAQQLSLEADNLNIAAAENDITLQITQAFLNILLAKENIKYYQDLVATSDAQVNQGEQFFTAGTLAKKDFMELQATRASDKYSLVLAQNTLRQNKLTLKQLLQLPVSTPFDVISSDTVNVNPSLIPLNDAEQTALSQRPEVKSGELGVQVQQVELEKAKSGLKPTLSLGGSLGANYSGNSPGQYFPQLNNTFSQVVGLTLSVPILDRKVTKTNETKAQLAIGQAQLALQDTKTTLSQNVEQAYINMQNALHQYNAATEQLKYTQEAFRIADAELKIGSFNMVDFLQQKNLYVQAEQAYIQAKYSVALYVKIYNFYSGIPVTENE